MKFLKMSNYLCRNYHLCVCVCVCVNNVFTTILLATTMFNLEMFMTGTIF